MTTAHDHLQGTREHHDPGARRLGDRLRSTALVAALVLGAPPVAGAGDLAEVAACTDSALPGKALTQTLGIDVTDAAGKVMESRGTLRWMRFDDGVTKTYIEVDRSISHRGVAILIREKPTRTPIVYMYSPELRRDRRITADALAGSILGSNFSYEDYIHLREPTRPIGTVTRLPDIEHQGRPAYVIETLPDVEASTYSRIRTVIDRQYCIPTRVELYALNGSLHKEISVEQASIVRIGNRWVPLRTHLLDHTDGSRSRMVASDVEIDPEISPHRFTVAELRRGH